VWESGVKVIDSFKGQKRNEYRLENIRGLVDNGVFYPSAYVILPEENVKISKHDLK
jgi:ribose 5-phosphate isomerase